MKKIVLISLSFLYLTSVFGVTINFHYCGGKLKNVSLYHKSSEKGCCGKKMKSKKCCKEKTTSFRLKDSHNFSVDLNVFENNFKLIGLQVAQIKLLVTNVYKPFFIPASHAPPNDDGNHLFLRNRILLI